MPTIHKIFTDVRLDDYQSIGLTKRSLDGIGWEAECDLAYELAERTTLTVPQARVLMESVRSSLPVELTWETKIGSRYEGYTIETTTTQVIVEYVFAPWNVRFNPSNPGTVRIRYSGFGHDVYTTQIVDAKSPKAVRTYRAVVDA